MASNVFKFVKTRPPKYTRPAPVDPEVMVLVAKLIEPDPPDSSVPLPVPLIFDPTEEQRFVAEILDPANTGRVDRETLRRRAVAQVASEHYVLNDPALARLISLESACRSVIAATGSELPADPAARWVTAIARLFEAGVTDGVPLANWVSSSVFDRILSTLWRSFYAHVLAGDVRRSDRARLTFWLRLFLAIRRVFAADGSSAPIAFARLRLGMPAILAPRVENTRPRPPDDDPDAADRVRRARLSQIARAMAGLEAVAAELEKIDRRLARVPVKVLNESRPKGSGADRRPPQTDVIGKNSAFESESFLLDERSLPSEMSDQLSAVGVAFVGRSVDAVTDDIDGALEVLETENEELRSRQVLAVRDGVLIRRVLFDDRPGEDA